MSWPVLEYFFLLASHPSSASSNMNHFASSAIVAVSSLGFLLAQKMKRQAAVWKEEDERDETS
jgi:hypothetical protein